MIVPFLELSLSSIAVSEDLLQAIYYLLGSPLYYRIQFCMCSRFLHSGMLWRPQISYHIHKHVSLLPVFEEQPTVKKTVSGSTLSVPIESTGLEATVVKLTAKRRNVYVDLWLGNCFITVEGFSSPSCFLLQYFATRLRYRHFNHSLFPSLLGSRGLGGESC